ncbi:MAG TPA: metallophosphoesterase family protein [Dehalococcoidia bacterium]|nr:metallophosphoesterase family protein [Dehalococcoidia bacterium]
MRIGVVSDTHGFLDPRLPAALEGVEAILHAGDVGARAALDALAAIAPLYAVRGNNDDRLGGLGLPLRLDVTLAGVRFHLVHQLPHAEPGDAQVVVYGHTHRPLAERREGRLYVNPGAAGRVGFHRTLSLALLETRDGAVAVEPVELGPRLAVARTPARRKAG